MSNSIKGRRERTKTDEAPSASSAKPPGISDGDSAKQRFEFDKMQLQLALDTYKTLYTMMGTVLGSLIAADVAILAAGVSKRSAFICLTSAFFTLTIHQMRRLFERAMVPVAYVAIKIEQSYAEEDEIADGLMTTFLFVTSGNTKTLSDQDEVIPGTSYEYAKALAHLGNSGKSHEERMSRLRQMPTPTLHKSRSGLIIGAALCVNVGAAAWCVYVNAVNGPESGQGTPVPEPQALHQVEPPSIPAPTPVHSFAIPSRAMDRQ